jgi:uncharacterized iron-regulated membrane protein
MPSGSVEGVHILGAPVDDHQAGHLVAIATGEDPRILGPVRVPDQHIRAGDASVVQRCVQLVRDAAGRARLRAGLAPAEAGPVVGDDATEGRQFGLD